MCFAEDVIAMSIFSKNVMFSEAIGKVTLNGVPIKGAQIERYYQWAWNDKEGIDNTITDNNGGFRLSLIENNSGISGLIPHEPLISQKITITYNGKEYIAWQYVKRNYDKNGELKGKPISLNCELSKEPEHNGIYYGICTNND
jgi:hypothetical protein